MSLLVCRLLNPEAEDLVWADIPVLIMRREGGGGGIQAEGRGGRAEKGVTYKRKREEGDGKEEQKMNIEKMEVR